MKFHQAYYTWDWNQLTKYQGGLGIHASSNRNSDFLLYCMNLGSKLNPEREDAKYTAEFLLYSGELGYVGAYISPREDVGNKKRANMLCHLFVPSERQEHIRLEEYLAGHPFDTEVGESTVLDEVDIEPVTMQYDTLLEKYSFNPKKMAVLIWRFYRRLYNEVAKIPMVISAEKHPDSPDKREYSRIAREMTWLLSCLAPKKEFMANKWYKKLTYGVYNERNLEQISLYYTDDDGWKDSFYIDDTYHETEEEISPVFLKMGELACSSIEDLQCFLEELRSISAEKELKMDQLENLYERWKLNHGYEMEESRLLELLPELLRGSSNSLWYRDFLYQAVECTQLTDQKLLRQLWTELVVKTRKRYESMDGEGQEKYHSLSYSLLNKMYDISQKDYTAALNSLPAEAKKNTLQMFMENDSHIILGELDEMTDLSALMNCTKKYDSLTGYDEIRKRILDFAYSLYEEGEKEDREKLSDFMLESMFSEEWKEYLEQWIGRIEEDCIGYLESQEGRIEKRFFQRVYGRLLYYAKEKASHQEKDKVLEREAILREEGGYEIGHVMIREFQTLKKNWTIAKEVQYLKDASLERLLERPLQELNYDKCYEQWFLSVKRYLNGMLKKDDFKKMLVYRTDGYRLVKEDKLSKEIWTSFDKSLRGLLSMPGTDLSWKFLYFTNEPCEKISEIWDYVRSDLYEEFYALLEEYPVTGGRIKEKADSTKSSRSAYLLWERVYNGYRINLSEIEALEKYRFFDMNGLLNKMDQTILSKAMVTEADLMNLCALSYYRIHDGKKPLTQRIKRHQEVLYKNQSLRRMLGEPARVRPVEFNLNRPLMEVLKEMCLVSRKMELEESKELDFVKTAQLIREMKAFWGPREMSRVPGVDYMIFRMKYRLDEEKRELADIKHKMGKQMEELDVLKREEEILLAQLQKCRSKMAGVKEELEKTKKEAEEKVTEYMKDCKSAGEQPDPVAQDVDQMTKDCGKIQQETMAPVPENAEEKTLWFASDIAGDELFE